MELLRRLVFVREISEEHRFPGVTVASTLDILYGAESSVLFPGMLWGGMTADIQILMQSGLNLTQIDAATGGNWRIFSKLGAGIHTDPDGTQLSQFVSNNYVCTDRVEFLLHAWSSTVFSGQDPDLAIQNLVQPIVSAIVSKIQSGEIE